MALSLGSLRKAVLAAVLAMGAKAAFLSDAAGLVAAIRAVAPEA